MPSGKRFLSLLTHSTSSLTLSFERRPSAFLIRLVFDMSMIFLSILTTAWVIFLFLDTRNQASKGQIEHCPLLQMFSQGYQLVEGL